MDPFPSCPDRCPSCGAQIKKRYTAGGFDFFGCTAYPACRWTGREATPTPEAPEAPALPFLRVPIGQ